MSLARSTPAAGDDHIWDTRCKPLISLSLKSIGSFKRELAFPFRVNHLRTAVSTLR